MTSIIEDPDGATPLDPDELEGLKFKHITTRGQLNEVEQINVQNGLMWLRRKRKTQILSEEFARELHRRLFGEIWRWAGEFRQTEKSIGIDPIYIGVQIKVLLDDAAYWAEHGTFSPIEAAARLHHRLVQIHCFPNRNGRHARIMADTYLKECFSHPPIDWAAGHDLMRSNERRDAYIAALRSADTYDYNPLLVFMGARTND